jgi:hypothetical protein
MSFSFVEPGTQHPQTGRRRVRGATELHRCVENAEQGQQDRSRAG